VVGLPHLYTHPVSPSVFGLQFQEHSGSKHSGGSFVAVFTLVEKTGIGQRDTEEEEII